MIIRKKKGEIISKRNLEVHVIKEVIDNYIIYIYIYID